MNAALTPRAPPYEPVELARGLIPLLAQLAPEAERLRRPSDGAIAALEEAGLLRMMFPRRAGGVGHTLMKHVETVAMLARGCPGTAWAFGLLSGVTASAASMPRAITEQVFRRGDERVCSVAGQVGTAQLRDGAYVVNGRWGYASGCMHAAWALNGVRILDESGQQVDAGFAFLGLPHGPHPDAAITVEDTWHVSGLSASGSHTVVAREARVPVSLVLRFSQLRAAAASTPAAALEPRDRWPVEPLFALGVLSPMLGAADALLEHVRTGMSQRPTIGWKYPTQADTATLVSQFGEAALQIDGAWLHVRRAVALVDDTAQQRPLCGFEKARLQADCGHAMRLLRRAAEHLMEIAGPGAFAASSPLQRLWRDLSLGSRHTALNSPLGNELYGRALLGLESNLHLLADIRAAQ